MYKDLTIKPIDQGIGYSGVFPAMASDCEVLVECKDKLLATQLIESVYMEAKRIEKKFSRYVNDNIVHTINNANGNTIKLDAETTQLIDFAFTCYQLSEGLFDITSGILRKVWRFDGSDNIPSLKQIKPLLNLMGLQHLKWSPPYLTIPKGMEIDLGGIGKEYAVDSCLKQTQTITTEVPILLNFGGDLICNRARLNEQAWKIGIENVGGGDSAIVALKKGALATSGDANRFLYKAGIRYSHILNPITGYPIKEAARSITVAAESCVEAGLISTLAMLQGSEASSFLAEQQVKHWIQT